MQASGSEGNSLSVKMVRGLVTGLGQDTPHHSRDDKVDSDNPEKPKVGRFSVEINNTSTTPLSSQASYFPSSEDLSANSSLSRSVSQVLADSPQTEMRNSVEARSADINGNVLADERLAPIYGIDDDGDGEYVRLCKSIPEGYCVDAENGKDEDGYTLLKRIFRDPPKPDDAQLESTLVFIDSKNQSFDEVGADAPVFDTSFLTTTKVGMPVNIDYPESDSGSLGESYIDLGDEQPSLEPGSSAPDLSTVALPSDTGRALEDPELQLPDSLLPKGEHDRCGTPSDFEFSSNDVIVESDDDVSADTDSFDLCRSVSGDTGNNTEVEAVVTDGPEVLEPLSIVHESKADFVSISMDSIDTPVEGVSLPEQFSTEQSSLHLVLRLREGFDPGLQNIEYQSDSDSLSYLSGSSGEDSTDSLSITSEFSSSTVSYSSDSSSEDDTGTECTTPVFSSRETLCDDEDCCDDSSAGLQNTSKAFPVLSVSLTSGDDSGSDRSTYEPAEGRSGSIHMLSESFLDDKSVDGEEPSYAPSGPEMQHNVSMELFPQVCQATSAHRNISRKEREENKPVLPGWGGTSRVSGRREDSWHKGPADWYDFKQSSKLAYRPLSQGTPRLEATSEESETRNYSPVRNTKNRMQTETRKSADIQQIDAFVEAQAKKFKDSVSAYNQDKNGLPVTAFSRRENQRNKPEFKAPTVNQIKSEREGLAYRVNGEKSVWVASFDQFIETTV